MQKKVLILGGYGNTGYLIARLLLQESDVQLVIAGRDLNRAQGTSHKLNNEFNTDRVSGKQVDAADMNKLREAFENVDLVVVASSTIDYVHNVCNSALEAGIDYLDVQLSSPVKLAVLNSLREKIKNDGRCFITDGGFHPGVPAALVRYAAIKFDILESANISSIIKLNWKELQFSESTSSEFIDELKNFNPLVLKDKQWIKMSMRKLPKFNFGELFGARYCTPMFLEELRSLPDEIPSLNETGFYIAGFNWMTDYIIMPVAFAGFKIFGEKVKRPMGELFSWSLKNFSKPPFGVILQLEAKGLKDKQYSSLHMRLAHDDAYVLTAVPVVACLLQYLNGDIRKPGLWFQANLVGPIQFIQNMERLGVRITIE
ncbi:MAG: saccharopine dehydrogenase NADP-binding domain-containing protein [Ignavibacteria bacterium]|jgi:saccharopine dehydrogenase (NAD+, L-lysine-forming)